MEMTRITGLGAVLRGGFPFVFGRLLLRRPPFLVKLVMFPVCSLEEEEEEEERGSAADTQHFMKTEYQYYCWR